jgi:cell division protein YceG involved in septum cleavage
VQVTSHDDEYAGFDDFIDGLIATRTTERKTRTNDEGFYELKQLNPGKYRVSLEHGNFTVENLRGILVAEGKQADAGSVALKSGGSVRGRVLDQSGKPLSRGWVRMFNNEGASYPARTDTEGRYVIEHVAPGTYTISATRSAASGGDVFENLVEGQNSEQTVNVLEGQETNRDLNLGN